MGSSTPAPEAPVATLLLPLVAATFLMGSAFIAGKVLLDAGVPPFPLVGWRFFVAAIATLALALARGTPLREMLDLRSLGLRGFALLALVGMLQTAGVMALLFLALQTVSAANAAVLLFTNPVWVGLLGRVFLHEPARPGAGLGLALGVAGTALAIGWVDRLLQGTAPGSLQGQWIGLGAALCWSVSTILHKRARLPLGAWKLNFWQMLIGSLAVFALAQASGQHWPEGTSASQWAWFAWLAVPGSTGAFGLWFLALERGGAVRTSSFLFLAPLFAVVLAWLILGTTLTPLQGLGALLIGLALWQVNR